MSATRSLSTQIKTPVSTASKTSPNVWTVTIDGVFEVYEGLTISIITPEASNGASTTLNVNGLGAKSIVMADQASSPLNITTNQILNLAFINGKFVIQNIYPVYVPVIESFVASAGQTVITLAHTYDVGTNALSVHVNGNYQQTGSYTETGNNSISFSEALTAGDKVEVKINAKNPGFVFSAGVVSYQAVGGVTRTLDKKLGDVVSVKDFGAVGDGVSDDSNAIQTAINSISSGYLYFPKGKYNIGTTSLVVSKPNRIVMYGNGSFYDDSEHGTSIIYSGSDAAIIAGVADGNPDTTGSTRDFTIKGIAVVNGGSAPVGIRLQNLSEGVVENCRTRYFTSKQIELYGGNVITRIDNNELMGNQNGSCYGIYCGDYQFGNYVVHARGNHLVQLDYAGRFSEGRYLNWRDNIVENIAQHVYLFETAGYISHANFEKNYHENIHGYAFKGDAFTGSVLFLSVSNNEFWPASGVTSFGNLPKQKFTSHDVRDNIIIDSNWNNKAYLGLTSVYSSTNVFDPTTTVVLAQPTNIEYEDALVYALRKNELLKSSGDFADLTGGTAGTFTKTGGAPTGWTNRASPAWQLVADGISGTFVCYVPGAGDYDRCAYTLTLTPVNRTRYFVVGFTSKGWTALRADGNVLYDSGSNVANYHTEVVFFTVPANAASTTLLFGTNANNPFYMAEARFFEIGVADYNEPGTMGGAIQNAVKRLMKRGIY